MTHEGEKAFEATSSLGNYEVNQLDGLTHSEITAAALVLQSRNKTDISEI